jgi:hypothetical protein
MERVAMELIGSHYAILLQDRQLRSTLVSDESEQAARPPLPVSAVVRRTGSLLAALREAIVELRLAKLAGRWCSTCGAYVDHVPGDVHRRLVDIPRGRTQYSF